jgi:hypothetical protein
MVLFFSSLVMPILFWFGVVDMGRLQWAASDLAGSSSDVLQASGLDAIIGYASDAVLAVLGGLVWWVASLCVLLPIMSVRFLFPGAGPILWLRRRRFGQETPKSLGAICAVGGNGAGWTEWEISYVKTADEYFTVKGRIGERHIGASVSEVDNLLRISLKDGRFKERKILSRCALPLEPIEADQV